MTSVRELKIEHAALTGWTQAVANAALPFEARWTLGTLKRVDPDLHRRLIAQRDRFDKALIVGTADEIAVEGACMCRGWIAAVMAVERAGEGDNACLLGQCPDTGFRVAIGNQKASAVRAHDLYGKDIIWVTPDEVAGVLAASEAFKPVVTIKRLYPGAEVVTSRPKPVASTEFNKVAEQGNPK